MSIIVPHIGKQPTRHHAVPYLWRVSCSCGWYALASCEAACREAFHSHQYEEEPFPSDQLFDIKDSPNERKN